MPNNNYRRGADFERKVVDLFRSVGYSASRTGGSHGIYDVIAVNRERVCIIQCKTGKSPFSNCDWNDLVVHGEIYGAHPILATRDERGGIKLTYLKERVKPRQREKPSIDVSNLLEGGWCNERAIGRHQAELSQVHQAGYEPTVDTGSTTDPYTGADESA
jgi:Holliday junction resolvase